MKITKKELNQNYYFIVRGGYCEFQTLLKNHARTIGSASGVYGWNWTAYEIEGSNGERIAICTGYRDMTGKRLEGLSKYEEKAKALWQWENKRPYSEKIKAHKRLLKQFADAIIKKYEM